MVQKIIDKYYQIMFILELSDYLLVYKLEHIQSQNFKMCTGTKFRWKSTFESCDFRNGMFI